MNASSHCRPWTPDYAPVHAVDRTKIIEPVIAQRQTEPGVLSTSCNGSAIEMRTWQVRDA